MTRTIINEPFESTVTCAETAHKQVHTHAKPWIGLHLFTGDFGNDGRLNVADRTFLELHLSPQTSGGLNAVLGFNRRQALTVHRVM